MTVRLINGNRVPLYQQVAQTLRQRVRTGVYRTDSPLPPLRELSAEFGVSTHVIQNAIYALEKDKVVVTHHGKGVMVIEEKPCEQAAIFFGMIEPYESHMGFESLILRAAEKVFSQRNDFMVTRSSEGNAANERAVAEHFARNGLKGIIVWPVVNDPNGPFFAKLAQSLPVVIIDRKIDACPLPTITHDMHQAGQDICHHVLETLGRKKLLVLMDNLNLPSYHDFIGGLHGEAANIKREKDITIVSVPASALCYQLNMGNFSQVSHYQNKIKKLLIKGGFDTVFCFQDEILYHVILESGLIDSFPDLQLATFVSGKTISRWRTLRDHNVLEWLLSPSLIVQAAANFLQQWIYTRNKPKNISPIPVKLIDAGESKN